MRAEKSGHMAWCALVALQFARRDGLVASPAQENLFLIRWLATALKQRRFHRSVTPDIEWLLNQGRTKGMGAGLAGKMDYLWRSCCGILAEQSDLFRLTYALEMAKDQGWIYRLLGDREWSAREGAQPPSGVSEVCLSTISLETAFCEAGGQVQPLPGYITGHIGGLIGLLRHCGWSADADPACPHRYVFSACSGTEHNRASQDDTLRK